MSVLVGLPSGNVGLAAVSPALAVVGLVAAYLATIWAGFRLDAGRGAAIAISACLLAQPSIGFNYVGLLIPAVVALWSVDRVAGLIAIIAVPIVAVVSPPVASVVVVALAVLRPGERLGVSTEPTALTASSVTASPARPG
jgi:hypothetical protein